MKDKKPEDEPTNLAANQVCGIVMPISAIDNCSESHWTDVQEILSDAIDSAGFTPNVVSNADDVGIIQKRIIQNLYENPIVVVDVSGKNPNVMFELGLRLAFDKPTIIVKDDKTSYSFDTSPIEHLEYPRDLRYAKIVEFKEGLRSKIEATHQKATSDKNYTTFLKHFGTFTVAKLDTQEVSKEDYILEELRGLRQAFGVLPSLFRESPSGASSEDAPPMLCVREATEDQVKKIVETVIAQSESQTATIRGRGKGHFHVVFEPMGNRPAILKIAKAIHPTSRWLPQRA